MNLIELKDIVDKNSYTVLYKNIRRKKSLKKSFISIIIPVRGRVNFLEPCLKHLLKSIEFIKNDINILVVEHSDVIEHKSICEKYGVNYFWIDGTDTKFNKCLCHNIGSLLNKNSEYFLFHDLDCLVKEDFFKNLLENKENKNSKCLQTFYNRRVLYMNHDDTEKIIKNEKTINDVINLTVGDYGAPGGSIFIEKDLFFKVGGYDPELFYGWSPEDIFFWNKVEFFEKVHSVDEPKNELYHMFHELQSNNDSIVLENLYENIKKLNSEEMSEFIKYKSEILKKYML